MTTNPPPPGSGSGQPEDDPFQKQPPAGSGSGSPYDSPQGGTPPPSDPYGTPQGGTPPPSDPYGTPPPPPNDGGFGTPPPPPGGGSPYNTPPPPPPGGGDPYGGGGAFGGYGGGPDPLQGMPPLADMGKRIAARIIDALIIGIPLGLIQLPFNNRIVETDTDDLGEVVTASYSGSSFIWTLIAVVAFVGYEWFMVKKNGQTLGKKLMNLRVAMLQDGSTPPSSPALTRAAVLWLPALLCCPCLWWLILIVMVMTDKPYRQALHDKAAKTVVVSTV
ncbi:RDD family protein [Streptomyces indicus]|uniref:RDD family protein n=1 Tax=Streptomyces indicus TaxID=417292 RepID=A0A1G9DW16_9ACTN|nr:RDD family protein [Streptomyces indicus]SDK68038.1 RDD family protein [Streptomyces indicus]